jgi:ribosomal protein S18 acetylase RimI-like enzyme
MSILKDLSFWKKLQKSDMPQIEAFLRKREKFCVSAISRLNAGITDEVWAVEKDSAISALLFYGKRLLYPVFAFSPTELSAEKSSIEDLPLPLFFPQMLKSEYFHACQGLAKDMILLEGVLRKKGFTPIVCYDYELRQLAGNVPQQAAREDLKVRKATMADAGELFVLQANYEKEEVMPPGAQFDPALCRKTVEHIIEENMLLTAEYKGRLVGKVNINAQSWNYLQIGGVYVLPEYRGLGIAQAMTAALVRELSPFNKLFTLYVKKANLPALRVYDKLGFVIIEDYRISYFN